ncbi:D-alanine--D-alanine ligase family protein [Maribacter sp. 2-571]|uniref:D-alanine--D-alanine ligase family protein n=1 Tax=Maribacter sp. 2-571 TaxID=3417569 RepID=UPI003D35705E
MGFQSLFAVAHPDGRWSVSKKLSGPLTKISFKEMLDLIGAVDIAICHMFCKKGMISIRILLEDVLDIPVVGSSGHSLAVAQNKFLAKSLVAEAGVAVPLGQKLKYGPTIISNVRVDQFPVIIKPNNADNSDGLSLVFEKNEMPAAFKKAGQFDDSILVETYIPGREIRGALIESGEGLIIPPFIEYLVDNDHPIRNPEDKLLFNDSGKLMGQSKKENVPAMCPAELDDSLKEKLVSAMKIAHVALDCRDYSMFDFRIASDTNKVYMLETGFFWSFSPKSMISRMLREAGISLLETTHAIWSRTFERGRR